MKYQSKDTMLRFIKENEDKKPVKINLEELFVNGECVGDKMEEYLKERAISSTALAKVMISPKAFKQEYDSQTDESEEKRKDFLELGSIIHEALLEPSKFKKIKVAPDANLTQKKDIRKLIRFYLSLAPKKRVKGINKMGLYELRDELKDIQKTCKYRIVSQKQKDIVDKIKKNYFDYNGGIIPKILKGAVTEHSVYVQDEDYLLQEKIRPDKFNIEENIGVNLIISLKTTSAKSLWEFKRQIRSLHYGIKEGFYQRVMKNATGRNWGTAMIVVQTIEPFDIFLLWWTEEDIHFGQQDTAHWLGYVNDCFEEESFLGVENLAEDGDFGIIESNLYGDYIPDYPNVRVK